MHIDDEPLSNDDAADLLADFEADEVSEEEFEGSAESAADPDQEIIETDDPSVEIDDDGEPIEADAEVEVEVEVEPETAIGPPQFWGAEDKAAFAELTPEAQQLLLKVDTQREGAVRQKMQESAEARKAAEAQAQAYDQRIAGLNGFITEREQALKSYEGINWADEIALAGGDPHKLANVNAHKAQFDQLKQDVQSARQYQTQAEADERNNALRQLDAELPNIDPKLADPAERVKAFQEVADFAVSEGAIAADEIAYITPKQFAIARDAMKWRNAQAKAQKPRPKPGAKTGGPALKPGASGRASSSRTARNRNIPSKGRLSNSQAAALLADFD